MPALTKTTFQAGANEALAAVDVYAQKGGSIINGVKSLLSGNINSDSVKSLLNQSVDLSKIAPVQSQYLQSKAGNLTLSVDNLTQSIMKTNPALMGALNNMAADVKANVLAPDGLVSDIKTTLGGMVSAIEGIDLSNVASIGKAVQSLVSDINLPFSFSDIGAMAGVAGNLVMEAADYGMTGLYTVFAEAKEFAGPGLQAITEAIGPTLIELSNNDLLKEVASTAGGIYLHNKFPNFVPDYMANYKSQFKSVTDQFDATGKSIADDFKSMKESFTKINPNWQAGARAAATVISGIPSAKASGPAKDATKTSTDKEAPQVFELVDGAMTPDPSGTMMTPDLNTAFTAGDQTYAMLAADVITDDVYTALKTEAPAAFS